MNFSSRFLKLKEMKKTISIVSLIISFAIILSSCMRSKDDQTKSKLTNQLESSERKGDNSQKPNVNANIQNSKELSDSLFSISPSGFIVEELVNPSAEAELIFFDNGKFVYRNIPQHDEDYHYNTGNWTLLNDSLFVLLDKKIYSRGAGEIIEVQPSSRFENGKRHKDYILTINEISDTILFDWEKFKVNVLDTDNYKWILKSPIYKDYEKYVRSLNGDYCKLSMELVDSLYITDLQAKNVLRIARNEIFARYGYIFKSNDLKSYFEEKSWYKPKYEDVTDYLTEIEKKNIELIMKLENN